MILKMLILKSILFLSWTIGEITKLINENDTFKWVWLELYVEFTFCQKENTFVL